MNHADIKAFSQTKSLLSSMVVGAMGWDQKKHFAEHDGSPRVFLYVHDVSKDWTWMASAVRESFITVSEQSTGDQSATQMAINLIGRVVCLVSEDRADGSEILCGEDWEQVLGTLLAVYAGNTKTWENASHFRDGGHFVVVVYRQGASESITLRPFAALGDDTVPMPVDELLNAVNQVIQIDMVNHPEWVHGK